VYKVVVKIGTCETSAEMPLVITADEEMSMIHATGVYPNPTEGVVNLKFKEESQVFVMNSHGQLIGKLTLKKTQDHYEGTFDMGKFPSGLYVFKAYGGGRSSTIKVLKR
ncbi:MAG: T9SS type A sorting domain-containing protein, partial [Cyclobacteriaceae bacterium]|nr:T9SS type A sorting domain-containing protein [Cyclobacteriaceae bacterium]